MFEIIFSIVVLLILVVGLFYEFIESFILRLLGKQEPENFYPNNLSASHRPSHVSHGMIYKKSGPDKGKIIGTETLNNNYYRDLMND